MYLICVNETFGSIDFSALAIVQFQINDYTLRGEPEGTVAPRSFTVHHTWAISSGARGFPRENHFVSKIIFAYAESCS